MKHQRYSENSGGRRYEKPLVQEVKLRPEEAVLGNCKTASSVGPLGTACSSPTQCNSLAS